MAKEQEAAPAPTPEAPQVDNSGIINLPSSEEPPTPIEVELGELSLDAEGDAGAEADAAPPAPPPKPKKTLRADGRIQNLTTRATQAETAAERYKREAEELRAQSQTTRQQYEGASTAAMQHFKEASELKVRLAQRDLKDAIDAGDSTAQADAQAKMSEAQAALNDVRNWESQQAALKKAAPPAPEPAAKPEGQRAQQPQAEAQLHPDTQAWVDANPWFQPGSEDFDPAMHNAAARYGALLEAEYQQEGRAAAVGSAEYFAQIDTYMRGRFPDAYADDDGGEPAPPAPPPRPRTPPMARRQEPVAASTKTLPNGAILKTLPNGKRSIVLDADQRTFARNLWKNGTMSIIDPQTKQSRPVRNEQEAYQAFGAQLVADAQRQNQKGQR